MSDVGQRERFTQDRVIRFFADQLGYRYLGNWAAGSRTNGIETDLLTVNLTARGYSGSLVKRTLYELDKAAAMGPGRSLYEANEAVYGLLRYGVHVKPGVGEQTETVHLVDWQHPEANDFAVAEEVSVAGKHNKRPDVVLYVNGLALATIELKRSKVAVSEGIRQTIGNQQPDFIRQFFTTAQLTFAGNDVEGLRYAPIDTPEKYWLTWKEPAAADGGLPPVGDGVLDAALGQMCNKARLLELIHDFTVFDAGVRKAPRHNQFFAVKAAQERIARREGGIVWHTQGSGKSLIMVWLAKWLRENQDDARVLIITDRTELDEQIERVFLGVSEQIYRTSSGADLIATLRGAEKWLMCSLIHKFRGPSDGDSSEFAREVQQAAAGGFAARGNLFVFIDEAHRTQSGVMHRAMKALLPQAMFIGFTGTPLLKDDRATTIEMFGPYIHTYKFDEGVADGVILDLRYEARAIDQHITSPQRVDEWFESKTNGMTDLSRAELKKRWGTMQKVVSAEPRARQIVSDILMDFERQPRLADRRGNAILVGSSIYQACKFYDMFVAAGLRGKCAIVTSYIPSASDIAKENAGAGKSEMIRQYETYRQMLSDFFDEPADSAVNRIEEFELAVKKQFVENPGQMRLLIVVDKLLTGFDAPSATYLYIDKKMRDHGLFQAICRVNRLDGDDKDYGYIVDYQDLFNSLQSAITDYTAGSDYTGGALDGYNKEDVDGLLTDRLDAAKADLDEALERIRAVVEPVARPRGTRQYQEYFCAIEPGNAAQLKANEPKRVELYKAISSVARVYANIANEMEQAGYSSAEAHAIRTEVAHYLDVRAEVKLGAGEDIDFKAYEADMRYLLDTYIQADTSRVISDFADTSLVELIVDLGPDAIDRLPPAVRKDPESVAATIVNNVRKVIIDERALNPKYYEAMSELLDAVIAERNRGNLAYEQYLAELLDVATKVGTGDSGVVYSPWVMAAPHLAGARRALVDFGLPDGLAIEVDRAVIDSKPDSWVGNMMKEKLVRSAIRKVVPARFDRLDELFDLIKARHEYH